MGTEALLPGGKSPSTAASGAQERIAQGLFKESTPARQTLFKQYMEGLSTGGIQARLPIIQQALQQSKLAESDQLKSLNEQEGTIGAASTPYGIGAAAATRQPLEQATQAVPTNIVRNFLSTLPGFQSNVAQQTQAGLSASTAAQAQVRNAQTAAVSAIVSQAIQTGEKAAIACWIAARLFGMGTPQFYGARHYIFNVWRGPVARIIQRLYLRYGERLARSKRFCRLVAPLFEKAARLGMEDLGWVQH